MPKFEMPVDPYDPDWRALDSFTQGYIEAMFFTSTGYLEDEELEEAEFSDLAPDTLEAIQQDCLAFQDANSTDLGKVYELYSLGYDQSCAGNDYWYTRCGHGTGFWDRGLPGDISKALTDAAHADGSRDLYRGDDGKLYLQ